MNALSFRRPVTTTFLAFSIAVLATLYPSRVTSQLIGIKSVPVATGDQFLIYPSANLALGGGSFALQQLIAADRWNWWGPNTGQLLRDRSARNLYLHGF